MLWGLPSGPDPSWTAAVETLGTKYILGFNEPDVTYSGSSNILPAKAAAGYQTYMEPFSKSVKIGTPNVLWNNVGSSSGGQYDSAGWMQYFVGNCTACHFDFMAIHYYQDCDPSDGQRVQHGSKATSQMHTKPSRCLSGSLNFSAMERMRNRLLFCNKFCLGWIHKAMFRDMRILEHFQIIS